MKNKILGALTLLNMTGWVMSACAIDSESWLPCIVWVVTTLYLVLFTLANEDQMEELTRSILHRKQKRNLSTIYWTKDSKR